MEKITRQNRFYGPGLPTEGVVDEVEAYELGRAHARLQSIAPFLANQNAVIRNLYDAAEAIGLYFEEIVRLVEMTDQAFADLNGPDPAEPTHEDYRRGGAPTDPGDMVGIEGEAVTRAAIEATE